MQFSIVTPSFRNSEWLKLCIASVADQQGVTVEHLVQDSCSDDGTLDWLLHDPRVTAFVEKDSGMYDAVNRGFRKARGEILAYLNCDEQYLPGALQAVGDFFSSHPKVDVVLTDTIVVDAKGQYICHRKSLTPIRSHLWYRFPVLSCALFVRRSAVVAHGLYFDTQWHDLGDGYWVRKMMSEGVRMAVLRRFTSVFADTGENMNLGPNARRELQQALADVPTWGKLARPALVAHHRLRLLWNGSYSQKPLSYALFTRQSPQQRVVVRVEKPTGLWRNRTKSIFLPGSRIQAQP